MRIFDAGVSLSFNTDEELYFHATEPNFTLWQQIVKWWWREWYWLGRPVDLIPS